MPSTAFLRMTSRSLRSQTFHSPLSIRPFSQTTFRLSPRKMDQNKDDINTESMENTKSGTDNEVASQDQAAYDPNTTKPESELESAGRGNEESGNPLEYSGANKEVSKPRDPQEGGADKNASEGKKSGPGQ